MIDKVGGVILKDKKILVQRKKNNREECIIPGGKVEKNESYESALIREIKEELNADIEVNEYIGESIHHYPEKDIKLIFYKAKLLSKKVELLEHESCKWITKDEKDKFEFAGADIVEVIYGILNSMDVSIKEFEKIRINKQEKRGAFEKKIYLEEAE